MNYLLEQLAIIYESKEEHIDRCKKCYLNEPVDIQAYIDNAPTDELIDIFKRHLGSTAFENFNNAIRYELMLRSDFQDEF